MIVMGIVSKIACWRSVFLMWVSDRVGWTKTIEVPETAEHYAYKMRHGKQCHGYPNCADIGCLARSMPMWFRWLAGIKEDSSICFVKATCMLEDWCYLYDKKGASHD
jgi:hypothetical protein